MDGKKHSSTDPQFKNSFGLILNNKLFIHDFYKDGVINIDKIKKIFVIKKRNIKWNILSFCIAFILLEFLELSNYNSLMLKIIIFCTALLFIIIALKFKKHKYKLIIMSVNFDLNKILIDTEMKEDAKELVFYINRIIKDN